MLVENGIFTLLLYPKKETLMAQEICVGGCGRAADRLRAYTYANGDKICEDDLAELLRWTDKDVKEILVMTPEQRQDLDDEMCANSRLGSSKAERKARQFVSELLTVILQEGILEELFKEDGNSPREIEKAKEIVAKIVQTNRTGSDIARN